MLKVLFVCLGNICRSPTAHGVFEYKVNQRGLAERVITDSAGTAAWHVGKAPDSRSMAVASNRGYQLDHLRARQVRPEDFHQFDYILAMDEENLANLKSMAPDQYSATVSLFLPFAKGLSQAEVPDPYYGGDKGFEDVLDMISTASDALIDYLNKQHKL